MTFGFRTTRRFDLRWSSLGLKIRRFPRLMERVQCKLQRNRVPLERGACAILCVVRAGIILPGAFCITVRCGFTAVQYAVKTVS